MPAANFEDVDLDRLAAWRSTSGFERGCEGRQPSFRRFNDRTLAPEYRGHRVRLGAEGRRGARRSSLALGPIRVVQSCERFANIGGRHGFGRAEQPTQMRLILHCRGVRQP